MEIKNEERFAGKADTYKKFRKKKQTLKNIMG
jgi:hypothetical protein